MSKISLSRRRFLGRGLMATGALGFSSALPVAAREWQDYSESFSESLVDSVPIRPIRPDDEAAWKAIAKNYDVTSKITNLENAYWGIMVLPVLSEYKRLTEFINKENTYFARLQVSDTYRGLRETVAAFLNVGVDEIALTRGCYGNPPGPNRRLQQTQTRRYDPLCRS